MRKSIGTVARSIFVAMMLVKIASADPGTAEDRVALFDYILTATLERTAFSPYKISNIGPTGYQTIEELVREESLRLRDEFIAADTDAKLFYALQELSSLRWDSHLHVYPIDGGIQLEGLARGFGGKIESWTPHAPIKFKPDYGDPDHYFLFVSDLSRDISDLIDGPDPAIGDALLSVNGQPVEDYLDRLGRYHGKSSFNSLWWDMAYSLPLKAWFIDPALYSGDTITLGLRRADGEQYILELPYVRYETIDWSGYDDRYTDIARAEYVESRPEFAEEDEVFNSWKYPGYDRIFSTPSFDLYVNEDQQAFLIKWNLFTGDVRDHIQQFVDYAQANGKLHYATIWDGLRSRGGNYGVWMLQRMQPRPYRTTFGNLRISDITEELANDLRKRALERIGEQGRHEEVLDVQEIMHPDNGQFLVDWLDTDLAAAIENEQDYSNNVPFKNYYLPKHSDGMVYPADVHMSGPLVLLVGPAGCSQVDQFVSMVVDNNLGFSVGMPAGGCSNTWEWEEDLKFPISGEPVARYMWSVGHTIRPNGEVMEGNSSPVHIYVPLTSENYLDYYNQLFALAYRYIDDQRE